MEIRKADQKDLAEIMELYAQARVFMANTGNPTQWGSGYPQEDLIRADMENGNSYVAVQDGKLAATFMYRFGDDPTYEKIEDGAWLDEEPYGVIHRITARQGVKGAGAYCLQWGFAKCGNLRIDTHEDNKVMQHVLEKNGFRRCGRIYTDDGSPRVAYQRVRDA